MHWSEELTRDPAGASLVDNQLQSATFIVVPAEFHRAKVVPPLSWHSVKFGPAAKKSVPEEPGLYAFVVQIPYAGLPPHGWVMYIGQTGDGTSDATLRGRFGQYLQEKKKFKRARVFFMLNAWC